MAALLFKRQDPTGDDEYFGSGGPGDNGGSTSWWYSNTAEIVKYVIVFTFIGLLLLWILGGTVHAHRRIRQGKPLLAYHRWLVSRRHYQSCPPPNAYYVHDPNAPPGQQYQMHTWSYTNAPPQYNHDSPPAYQAPPGPPPGASKASPSQNVEQRPASPEQESGSVQRPAPVHAPASNDR